MNLQDIDMAKIPSGNYKKYLEKYEKLEEKLSRKGLRMHVPKWGATEFHMQYKIAYANKLAEADGQKSKVGNIYDFLVESRQGRATGIGSAKAAQKKWLENFGEYKPLNQFIYEGDFWDQVNSKYKELLDEGKSTYDAQKWISYYFFGSL